MSRQYRPGTNFLLNSDHQTTKRVLLNPAVKASERANAAVLHSPLISPLHCITVCPSRFEAEKLGEAVLRSGFVLTSAGTEGCSGTCSILYEKLLRTLPETDLNLISPVSGSLSINHPSGLN